MLPSDNFYLSNSAFKELQAVHAALKGAYRQQEKERQKLIKLKQLVIVFYCFILHFTRCVPIANFI